MTQPFTAQPSSSIFSRFSCPAGGWCEAFLDDATPRRQWQGLISSLNSLGPDVLDRRRERIERMRHEDGTTYNPFGDPSERSSPWSLDTVPFPLTASEWREIEAGIRQRAMLLSQVLGDVYGEQQLLRTGALPAELIFANPHFLRSCHNMFRPTPETGNTGRMPLAYYAADIYRAPDGRFTVLRDYGGYPAGLGYALENRIVISRVFPELYHQTQILRLAPFFQRFHSALLQQVSVRRSEASIVILTPGPDSPIYFEHALLSRYLGYPLVEGQDLTVRNGRVYQKKLAGLEPVDVIFRQISDSASDPFALRRETAAGVAGLLQAVRENNVEVINPVGCGFIDSPLLSLYLPELCRLLRREELLMPGRAGYWCGSQAGKAQVLEQLNRLQLRGSFGQPVPPRQHWEETIAQGSFNWLGMEPIQPSCVPVWQNPKTVATPCVLRIFACNDGTGFHVMPGGLAITAETVGELENNAPQLQKSKDIWVLSEEPVEPFSMLDGLQRVTELRRSSDLPSRVADNLLWLGRYLERAEGLVRMLRPVYRRLSGEARAEDIPEMLFLLDLLRSTGILPMEEIPAEQAAGGYDKDADHAANESDSAKGKGPTLEAVLQVPDSDSMLLPQLERTIFDITNPGSVCSILQQVRNVARNVRDRLSLDCWRVINHLEELTELSDGYSGEYRMASQPEDPLDFLEDALFTLSSFSGLAMESMTRGLGWRFMDMGRRIERGFNQLSIIRAGLRDVCEQPATTLEALLEVADSIMTYRSRYRTTFQIGPVLDLLIIDETNPKSLAFQFSQLADHVEHMPRQSDRRYSTLEERLALELLSSVRLLDPTGITCGPECDCESHLPNFLEKAEQSLNEFSRQITSHYLSRVVSTPHFSMFLGAHDE